MYSVDYMFLKVHHADLWGWWCLKEGRAGFHLYNYEKHIMFVDEMREVPKRGGGGTLSTEFQSDFLLSEHDRQTDHSMTHKASGAWHTFTKTHTNSGVSQKESIRVCHKCVSPFHSSWLCDYECFTALFTFIPVSLYSWSFVQHEILRNRFLLSWSS